ncbi:gp244 [Bacillus phage G]|uniref:Gp244 n=1 Tax=Bacillus phage G TaxID=2884420 RepID=G3M9Y5_9CAUD|nr:gp244 [Bacillus phage G]AEO93503.1 gp244 [Bacillus phage G]
MLKDEKDLKRYKIKEPFKKFLIKLIPCGIGSFGAHFFLAESGSSILIPIFVTLVMAHITSKIN